MSHELAAARTALAEFRATKGSQLKLVASEQRTQRQAMESMRRRYEALRAVFLRLTGTTYRMWTEHGPQHEWEECVEAARDPALWDRLVERGLAQTSDDRAQTRGRQQ